MPGHEVVTAYERGWGALQNGALLQSAENAGFDVIITTDQNLRYQQNLSDRRLAIIVLLTTSWPVIRPRADFVIHAVAQASLGSYVELAFPSPRA